MKQRRDFAVGVKVRGYGILNEFGEFDFIPEQTGVNRGRRKFIKQGDGFTLSETRESLLVHMNIHKQPNRLDLTKEFLKMCNNVLNVIREYEI